MESLTPRPEQEDKDKKFKSAKPEVIHLGGYDIVKNPESDIDFDALKTFLDEIDDKLKLDLTDPDPDDGLDFADERTWTFEDGGHKYFVKQKWYDVRQQRDTWRRHDHEQESTYGSILNEFVTTPEIEKIIEDAGLQEKIRNLGYEDIELVPVVAGVVRNRTGQKFLVYDYVEMDENSDHSVMEIVRNALEDGDIEPRDLDYNIHQDKNNPKRLFLIDIEGFRKI